MTKKIFCLFLCLVAILIIPTSGLAQNSEDNLSFYFFDVPEVKTKTGDCTFIRFPNGETMLIDAFIADAAPYVVEDLKSMGVTRIDHLVISHYHGDHIGGMPILMDAFEIGTVYSSGLRVYTASGISLLAKMLSMGLNEHTLRRGDALNVGDVSIEILNPVINNEVMAVFENGTIPSDPEVNVQSLVMKFVYKNFSALFTGDIYDEAEYWLMDEYGDELKVTLLKAPHHGSHTSSGARFLNMINPKYVVAMGNVGVIGAKNKYMRAGAESVYYTYMDGTVIASTDGQSVSIQGSK